MVCKRCGKEVFLPFKCPYCGSHFCTEHRLPENHDCPRKEFAIAPTKERKPIIIQKQESPDYRVAYDLPRFPRGAGFSGTEIKHLVVAMLLVVAIGLSPALYRPLGMELLIILAVMVAISFFIHEFAHKIAAQRRGLWAEFRLVITGALLTLISVFSPFFKVISPGAVMVRGVCDRETMGRISIAGPATNIVLSMVFFVAAFPFQETTSFLSEIFILSGSFNAWIALLNLIPFGIFDGFKVFLWNKAVWALAFATSLALTIISIPFL